MAIYEKRQLFRVKDSIVISYLGLNSQEVSHAIEQLNNPALSKNLFPSISKDQEPVDANVSVFGLAFQTHEVIPADTNLSMIFRLSSMKTSIYAVSSVSYCKKAEGNNCYQVGVKFRYMSKEDVRILEDYIVDELQKTLDETPDEG